MDAAVDEGLHALLGDDPLGLQPFCEGVTSGGGELEGKQTEHHNHDAVAVVGSERAVGLSYVGDEVEVKRRAERSAHLAELWRERKVWHRARERRVDLAGAGGMVQSE